MKKLFLTLSFLLIPVLCYGQITTSAYLTADDVTIEQLEANRVAMTNGINTSDGSLITDLSIISDKLDANANPENRWNEAFSDFVYTGILMPTSSSLTSVTTSGIAYIEGVRVVKDATSKLYTGDRYTYVDLSKTGVFTYQEITFAGTAPGVSLNSIRIAKVSSDTTTIPTVTDLRTTSLTSIAAATKIVDTAGTTGIQTEETSGEKILRFDTDSVERITLDDNGLGFKGSTTGTTYVIAAGTASGTLTLPAETGTILTTANAPVVGSLTVDQTNGTTDVEYDVTTYTPRAVIFFSNDANTSELSIGLDNVTASRYIADDTPTSANTYTNGANISINSVDAAGTYTGVIKSLDSDGFTITWTKGSSPTGTLTVLYMTIP